MNGGAGPRALVLCGPTASGKSSIALGVAELLGGEIVNADSRQIYRGMEVGTGVPSPAMRQRVTHHLYAFVDPSERYSAARFASDAAAAVREIHRRGKLALVVGGTGFYIEALLGTMPLDRPPPDEAVRARLRREIASHPPEVLWQWLQVRSKAVAAGVRSSDTYRILRALERVLCASASRGGPPPVGSDIRFTAARLVLAKEDLRERIVGRVREMFAGGIVQEAVAVRTAAPQAPALSGLGYAEALAFWDGRASEREAVGLAVRRTQQYAKRQETWFRRMQGVALVNALRERDAIAALAELARERLMLS